MVDRVATSSQNGRDFVLANTNNTSIRFCPQSRNNQSKQKSQFVFARKYTIDWWRTGEQPELEVCPKSPEEWPSQQLEMNRICCDLKINVFSMLRMSSHYE